MKSGIFSLGCLLGAVIPGALASYGAPSPASTTTGMVRDSTERWGTSPSPAPTTVTPKPKNGKATKATDVVQQKLGDCSGYCGVAFCECGGQVGCRGGVFGCGYQLGDPTAECFCDERCLRDGTCCSNYESVCVDGEAETAPAVAHAATTKAVDELQPAFLLSPACLQRCTTQSGSATCGDWIESGVPLSSLDGSCDCAKCASFHDSYYLNLPTTTFTVFS